MRLSETPQGVRAGRGLGWAGLGWAQMHEARGTFDLLSRVPTAGLAQTPWSELGQPAQTPPQQQQMMARTPKSAVSVSFRSARTTQPAAAAHRYIAAIAEKPVCIICVNSSTGTLLSLLLLSSAAADAADSERPHRVRSPCEITV